MGCWPSFFLFSFICKWVRLSFNPSVGFSISPFIHLSDCPSVPPSVRLLVRYTCAQLVQMTHWVAWLNSIISFSLLWNVLSVVWLVGSSVVHGWKSSKKLWEAFFINYFIHLSHPYSLWLFLTLHQIWEITYFFRQKSNCVIWLFKTKLVFL